MVIFSKWYTKIPYYKILFVEFDCMVLNYICLSFASDLSENVIIR